MPISIGPEKIGIETFRRQNKPFLDALDMLQTALKSSIEKVPSPEINKHDDERKDRSARAQRTARTERTARTTRTSRKCIEDEGGLQRRIMPSRSMPIYLRSSMNQFMHLAPDSARKRVQERSAVEIAAVKEEFKNDFHYFHPRHDFSAFIDDDVRNNVSAAFNRR